MIIGQVLKQVVNSFRDNLRRPLAGDSVALNPHNLPQYVRKTSAPSILAVAGEYYATGAGEMFRFLLTYLAGTCGWQVRAYSKNLTDADKAILVESGIGLVDEIVPEQYDLAIANTVGFGLDLVRTWHGELPCVMWVHEGEAVLWASRLPLGEWREAFSSAAHIVFQSRCQAERIFGPFTYKLQRGRDYSVIPNCLPVMETAPDPRFCCPPGRKRIVFLGSVYQRKQPHDLIDAVLALDRDDVECLFIGPVSDIGTLSQRHQSLLRTHSRFRLIGKVPRAEALAYLADADVLSLPSSDESQPLVLMEAARLGVPVVISDLPVYTDCWLHGTNCLKHGIGDVQTLTRHLQVCLDGRAPKPVLSEACCSSPEDFLGQFESVLRRLLPEATRSYAVAAPVPGSESQAAPSARES